MLKPNPKFFEIALSRAGVKPQQALFTDDKPENVAAAEALGIRSHLFTDTKELARFLRQHNYLLH